MKPFQKAIEKSKLERRLAKQKQQELLDVNMQIESISYTKIPAYRGMVINFLIKTNKGDIKYEQTTDRFETYEPQYSGGDIEPTYKEDQLIKQEIKRRIK